MKENNIGGTKATVKKIITYVGLIFVFFIYMFPFIFTVINSFKTKKEIIKTPLKLIRENGLNFDKFVKAYEKMDFIKAFTNSMIVTVSATAIVIVLAAMTAYYFVRINNKVSKIFFALMVASMIIPFQAIMIPLVSIYGAKLNILNSRATLIFMHTGFAMSMSVFIFHGFIKSSIPIALEEAAFLEGCSRTRTFFQVIFPLLKPTTATLVILNVMAFWNDFLLPSLVLSKEKLLTLPLSTYKFYGTYSADLGTIMAALVLTVFPILVLYIFLQKYIISGVVSGAVKS